MNWDLGGNILIASIFAWNSPQLCYIGMGMEAMDLLHPTRNKSCSLGRSICPPSETLTWWESLLTRRWNFFWNSASVSLGFIFILVTFFWVVTLTTGEAYNLTSYRYVARTFFNESYVPSFRAQVFEFPANLSRWLFWDRQIPDTNRASPPPVPSEIHSDKTETSF